MRLIDADELLEHIEDYGEGQYRLDLIDPYYVRNAPTVDAIPVPDNATNGDMIKAMFPNAKINYGLNGIVGVKFIHMTVFDLDWWNAPYNGGNANNFRSFNEYRESCGCQQDCDSTQCKDCGLYKEWKRNECKAESEPQESEVEDGNDD